MQNSKKKSTIGTSPQRQNSTQTVDSIQTVARSNVTTSKPALSAYGFRNAPRSVGAFIEEHDDDDSSTCTYDTMTNASALHPPTNNNNDDADDTTVTYDSVGGDVVEEAAKGKRQSSEANDKFAFERQDSNKTIAKSNVTSSPALAAYGFSSPPRPGGGSSGRYDDEDSTVTYDDTTQNSGGHSHNSGGQKNTFEDLDESITSLIEPVTPIRAVPRDTSAHNKARDSINDVPNAVLAILEEQNEISKNVAIMVSKTLKDIVKEDSEFGGGVLSESLLQQVQSCESAANILDQNQERCSTKIHSVLKILTTQLCFERNKTKALAEENKALLEDINILEKELASLHRDPPAFR